MIKHKASQRLKKSYIFSKITVNLVIKYAIKILSNNKEYGLE
jgi:hypothetical protein